MSLLVLVVLFVAGLFGFPMLASTYDKALGPPLTGLFVWLFLAFGLVGFSWLAKRATLRNVLGVFSFASAFIVFLLLAFIPFPGPGLPWSAYILCGGLGIFTGALPPLIVLEIYHSLTKNP